MKSMTGYGQGSVVTDELNLSVEIKSYNSRFLEIIHTMPTAFSPFEAEIDEAVKQTATRGHVEVTIRYRVLKNRLKITVNRDALEGYKAALDEISEATGIKTVFSFADLAAAGDLITEEEDIDSGFLAGPLRAALSVALGQFEESKVREGENTRCDLLRLLDGFEAAYDTVRSNAAALEDTIKQNLRSRFSEMLGDGNYDEGRFLQEVAVMLVKYSINEEITRLSAHIAEARRLIQGTGPCAKRLDFLSQEMNRETNTIGSKNILVPISMCVVEMKDCLENIREQIRNIE